MDAPLGKSRHTILVRAGGSDLHRCFATAQGARMRARKPFLAILSIACLAAGSSYGADTTPPAVTAITPAPGATLVAQPSAIVITFSEEIDPATVDGETVRLARSGGDGVLGNKYDIVVAPNSIFLSAPAELTLELTGVTLPDDLYQVALSGSLVSRSNLVAHWKFDDGSGTTLSDSSGNGNDATLNGIFWRTGKLGGAIEITGKSPRIFAPDNLVKDANPVSISAWFKTSGRGVIFGYQDQAPFTTPTQFVPILYVGTDGRLYGQFANGSANPMVSSGRVDVGWWYHVALVGSINSQTLYLNGVAVATLSGTIDHLNMSYNQIASGVADPSWPATKSNWFFYGGFLDDMRIYARVLTPGEISLLATTSWERAITDLAGNLLDGEFSGTFPSGDGTGGGDYASPFLLNADAPTVASTSPEDGATDVAICQVVKVVFSESMDRASAEAAFSIDGGVTGTFSWWRTTLTFTPSAPLAFNAAYTVTVDTGAEDLGGTALTTAYNVQFVTVGVPRLFTPICARLGAVAWGSTRWGDFDNDGDLDLAVAGSGTARIYQNNGDHTFTDIGAGLTGVRWAALAWGDYDGDGDLDLVITGNIDGTFWGARTKLYRNDGGAFVEVINLGLPGVFGGDVEWGDYDQDGDLDLVLTGKIDFNSNSGRSWIYRNDGGTFVDSGIYLVRFQASDAAWADYDLDGDLDLAIAGRTNSSGLYEAYIYENQGGVFTDAGAGLTGVNDASIAWGDYDADGDPDLALCGHDGNTWVTKVYRNDTGVFQEIPSGLTGVNGGAVAWGDYDNDGDLDLVLMGWTGATPVTQLYRNEGNDNFVDASASLPQVSKSAAAWGDYDNDGSLDLAIFGSMNVSAPFKVVGEIYRNTGGFPPNSSPTAAAGVNQIVNEGVEVTLDGSASFDPDGDPLTYAWAQTGGPAAALSDPAAAQPTFTAPDVATPTILTFQLTVADSVPLFATDTVDITVNDVEPPVAAVGSDLAVNEGDVVALDGSGSSDPDGDTLSYLWTQTAGPNVVLSDDAASQPLFTAPDVPGTATLTFQLTVTDSNGLADTISLNVTVNDTETPTANAGPDQIVNEGDPVALDGSGSSDPDADALVYSWTQIAGPAVALSDSTAVQPTFAAPNVAADTVLTFRLTVTDSGGLQATNDVNVTVLYGVDVPPLVTTAGLEIAGRLNNLSITSVQVNGQAVSVVSGSFVAAAAIVGPTTITITATNLSGVTTTRTLTVSP